MPMLTRQKRKLEESKLIEATSKKIHLERVSPPKLHSLPPVPPVTTPMMIPSVTPVAPTKPGNVQENKCAVKRTKIPSGMTLPVGISPQRISLDLNENRHHFNIPCTGKIFSPREWIQSGELFGKVSTGAVGSSPNSVPSGPAVDIIRIPISTGFSSSDPFLAIMDNFLSAEECAELLKISKDQDLKGEKFFAANDFFTDDMKNSMGATLEMQKFKNETPETRKLIEKVWPFFREDLNTVGVHFKRYTVEKSNKVGILPHHDNHVYTLLIYLNDVPNGGETAFPKMGVKISPKQGRAIWFHTLDMFNDEFYCIEEMVHEGLPISQGEKYIIQFLS